MNFSFLTKLCDSEHKTTRMAPLFTYIAPVLMSSQLIYGYLIRGKEK